MAVGVYSVHLEDRSISVKKSEKLLIDTAVDKLVNNEFLPNLQDSDWKSYVELIDGFDYLHERPAHGALVFNQKSVVCYGDVPFDQMVSNAINANLDIKVTNRSLYDYTFICAPEKFVPRNSITDYDKPRMTRAIKVGKDIEIPGIELWPEDSVATYVAWVGEPKTVGAKPTLFIQHDNAKLARKIINSYRI